MKKRYLIAPLLFLSAPLMVFAAGIESNPLVIFLQKIIVFIDQVLVPLLFTLAFVALLWGVFQYFIAGGANEEQRDKGKKFIVWAFIGLFVMTSVWGIVNLLTSSFGFDNQAPDIPRFGSPAGDGSSADPIFPSSDRECEATIQCDPGYTCIDNVCQR